MIQTIPQSLCAAGATLRPAAATGLCCALSALSARGNVSGEALPLNPGVPLSKPQACAERDLLVTTWPPPFNLDTLQPPQTKRGGAGLGFTGAACSRFGATCALTGPNPNPASPAAASAAPRSGSPALGRGFLLVTAWTSARTGSQPRAAKPGWFTRASPRAHAEGGPAAARGGPALAGFLAGRLGMERWGHPAELGPGRRSMSPGVLRCLLAENSLTQASRFATSASPARLQCPSGREARIILGQPLLRLFSFPVTVFSVPAFPL